MKSIILAAALAFGGAGIASAATIVNGSFETPGNQGAFGTYGTGSTAIDGWTVGSGNVDLVNTLWIAQDGDQAIDLDGNTPGSIFQDITGLVVGAAYRLSFYMSGNNAFDPTIKTMDVTVGGTSAAYSFDDTNGGAATGVWELNTFDFIASFATERLTFASTTGGNFAGPAIDNVSIEQLAPVPLPAGGLLLVGGLAGLAVLRRKRKSA